MLPGFDVLDMNQLNFVSNCCELIGEVAGPRGAEDKKEKPRGANRAFTGAHYVLVVKGNPIH
jgi:hypothetical protein